MENIQTLIEGFAYYREHGIKIFGQASSNPYHLLERSKDVPPDEAFVAELADGGFMWIEDGDPDTGRCYAEWVDRINARTRV